MSKTKKKRKSIDFHNCSSNNVTKPGKRKKQKSQHMKVRNVFAHEKRDNSSSVFVPRRSIRLLTNSFQRNLNNDSQITEAPSDSIILIDDSVIVCDSDNDTQNNELNRNKVGAQENNNDVILIDDDADESQVIVLDDCVAPSHNEANSSKQNQIHYPLTTYRRPGWGSRWTPNNDCNMRSKPIANPINLGSYPNYIPLITKSNVTSVQNENNMLLPFQQSSMNNKRKLRMIVIDGSNVGFGHSNGRYFSVKGLQICIDYFTKRGHKVVAFVPQFRVKHKQSSDPALLKKLQAEGLVIFTPSRDLDYKRICCYDDRYIVQCAADNNGVIVSNDNFRDLMKENSQWKTAIEERLLMPTWVDDTVMFPMDPLGKDGPNLDEFLQIP